MIVLPIVAYTLIGLIVARLAAGHFAWTFFYSQQERYKIIYKGKVAPSGDQWFGAWACALSLATIWPAVILVLMIGRMGPKIGAERNAQLVEAQKRIKELERDLLDR